LAIEAGTALTFEVPALIAGGVAIWRTRSLSSDTYERLRDIGLTARAGYESRAFAALVSIQTRLNRELTSDDRGDPGQFLEDIEGYRMELVSRGQLQRRFRRLDRSATAFFYALVLAEGLGIALVLHQAGLVSLPRVRLVGFVLCIVGAAAVVLLLAMRRLEVRIRRESTLDDGLG
jgi:hypothetical protein